MKLSRKQIDVIRLYTPEELKGKQISGWGGYTLGSYTPSGANWSYIAKYIDYNGAPVLVVTRFGEIM
jgi:hypothetical protein